MASCNYTFYKNYDIIKLHILYKPLIKKKYKCKLQNEHMNYVEKTSTSYSGIATNFYAIFSEENRNSSHRTATHHMLTQINMSTIKSAFLRF